eukprot:g2434.t1
MVTSMVTLAIKSELVVDEVSPSGFDASPIMHTNKSRKRIHFTGWVDMASDLIDSLRSQGRSLYNSSWGSSVAVGGRSAGNEDEGEDDMSDIGRNSHPAGADSPSDIDFPGQLGRSDAASNAGNDVCNDDDDDDDLTSSSIMAAARRMASSVLDHASSTLNYSMDLSSSAYDYYYPQSQGGDSSETSPTPCLTEETVSDSWYLIDDVDIPATTRTNVMDNSDEDGMYSSMGLVNILQGEGVLDSTKATFVRGQDCEYKGNLLLTTYRIAFVPTESSEADGWDVPVACIGDIISRGAIGKYTCSATILCKTFRQYKVAFDHDLGEHPLIHRELMTRAQRSPPHLTDAFAFKLGASFHLANATISNWLRYNDETVTAEYRRLGLGGDDWRLSSANVDFNLCPTYPRRFVVPAIIDDAAIHSIAAFRSRGRIPATTYRYAPSGATISRCAQPMVGLVRRARCREDEALLRALRNGSREEVYIIDCRSQAAALGNLAAGRGFEFSAHYGGSKLLFKNIDNIHAMRDSCKRLFELGRSISGQFDAQSRWLSHLEATRWLDHIHALMSAAVDCARLVQSGISILVHCSDGWDRTPQVTALAMLLLEPYYRTLDGFVLLVEREFCAFGHQFEARCGHFRQFWEDEHCSPIFQQWVDCVHQLLIQFPTAFEFNVDFLVALVEEVYSCRSGTFLGNSEAERESADVRGKCIPAWHFLLPERKHRRGSMQFLMHKHVNPIFEGVRLSVEELQRPPKEGHILLPDCRPSSLCVWKKLYFRGQEASPTAKNSSVSNPEGAKKGPRGSRNGIVAADSAARMLQRDALEAGMELEKLKEKVRRLEADLKRQKEVSSLKLRSVAARKNRLKTENSKLRREMQTRGHTLVMQREQRDGVLLSVTPGSKSKRRHSTSRLSTFLRR